jgi:hypothetical protein
LLIHGGAERGDDHGLRFPTGKERGAVGPGQDADADSDGAYFIRPSPIRTDPTLEDERAQLFAFDGLHHFWNLQLQRRLQVLHCTERLRHDLGHLSLPSEFLGDLNGLVHASGGQLPHALHHGHIQILRHHGRLGLAARFPKIALQGDDIPDHPMPYLQAFHQDLLRDLSGAPFHHHDPFIEAGDDQVEIAFPLLLTGGINDIFPSDPADTHGTDRPAKRDVRNR